MNISPRNTCAACGPLDPCRRCRKRREALVKKAPDAERKASRASDAWAGWELLTCDDGKEGWVWTTQILPVAKEDAEPTPKGGDILRRVEARLR
jgi:hypothetical protein